MKGNPLEYPVLDIGCGDPVNGAERMELSGLDGLEMLLPALGCRSMDLPW